MHMLADLFQYENVLQNLVFSTQISKLTESSQSRLPPESGCEGPQFLCSLPCPLGHTHFLIQIHLSFTRYFPCVTLPGQTSCNFVLQLKVSICA